MNAKYKITKTSVIDDEIIVNFNCSLDNEVIFSSSVTVPYNATSDDVLDRINATAYNVMMDTISVKEYKEKKENEKKESHNIAVALKTNIDKEIDKEKPVKKPEKMK